MSTSFTETLFAYSTSHPIYQVGPTLLRKDLRPAALLGDAAISKAVPEHDSRREPAMYINVLRHVGIGPECLAAGDDWIIIERLPARVLWQVGEPDIWVAVARWVASMHRRLAGVHTDGVPLLRYDTELARERASRAERAGTPKAVLAAHQRATRVLDDMSWTLIHGELYPSNVLVERSEDEPRSIDVWPVDWELAGIGPAVLDVAALTSGWPASDPTRVAMERAYFEAASPRCTSDEWATGLRAARLFICVQWLGWPCWNPPLHHRHDWLAEAVALARCL